MIKISYTKLVTSEGSRYIRRLCKHWSHKFEVSFDDEHGTINFGEAQCNLFATATSLEIQITAQISALSELQMVVIDHLQRFTLPEENLKLEWQILDVEK